MSTFLSNRITEDGARRDLEFAPTRSTRGFWQCALRLGGVRVATWKSRNQEIKKSTV